MCWCGIYGFFCGVRLVGCCSWVGCVGWSELVCKVVGSWDWLVGICGSVVSWVGGYECGICCCGCGFVCLVLCFC